MRFDARFTAITVLGAAALLACGDDEDGTGGGTTETTTSTGTTTTGGSPTSTTGSSSSTGMATGGGGGELAADAEPCVDDEQCSGGVCLGEEEFGFAAGYCTGLCSEVFMISCAQGSLCLGAGDGALCLKECDPQGNDCTGVGQSCVDWFGDQSTFVCLGGCTDDAQCQVSCDNDSQLCGTAEICDSAMDEDADLLRDCEEIDCAADATCSAAIADACAEAIDISAGGQFTGTTAGGTNVFARVCVGFGSYPAGSNENENVFVFNAAADGFLTIDTSATSGEYDLYMRTDCDDATTNAPGCNFVGDTVNVQVTAGQSYFFYVDAYLGDASYVLDVEFAPDVCGDGLLVPTEDCDDGNLATGDGCDASCQVEVPFFCNAATTIGLGTTNGNTTTGSNALIAQTCTFGGGEGLEVIYEFTAPATADFEFVLASATDQGIHVRTDCPDPVSEIACVDDFFMGEDETLVVPMTSGTTYTVTVDAYSPGNEGPFALTVTQL
jgi:cysteine-rich repeat protein